MQLSTCEYRSGHSAIERVRVKVGRQPLRKASIR